MDMNKCVVTSPATEEKSEPFAQTTDAIISAAIEAGRKTCQGWSKNTFVAQRDELIEKIAQLHCDRREKLAEIIVREMRKP